MEFRWSPQQIALHERLRDIGERQPAAADSGPAAAFPRSAWQDLANEGVMALAVPRPYGGLEHDPLTCSFALDGLGYGCRDLGLLFSLGAHTWAVELPLMKFGSTHQQERYLPGLANGTLIGAHAITERRAGSDALALETVAHTDGAKYILTGAKHFVTNAPVADVFLVYATLDPRLGFTGATAFIVDRDQAGLRVEEEDEKIGLRTSAWGRVVLDECVLGEEQRLGACKQGSQIFGTVMAWERSLLLAPLLGAMARQVDECIAYANTRRQFGKRISTFQAVTNRIVDMYVRLENARMVSYRAAWELANGNRSMFPEIAKLQVSEASVALFQDAMQVLGAMGFTTGAGIGQRLQAALGARISSGTSDMQRVVIATKLGLK